VYDLDGVEKRFERDWLTGRFCNAAKAAWSSSEVGGVEHETAEWVDEAEEEAEEDDEDEDLSSGEGEGEASGGTKEMGGSMSMDVGGEEKGV
jgi:hypothetical protein